MKQNKKQPEFIELLRFFGEFSRGTGFAGRAAGLCEQSWGFCETRAFSAASNRRKCEILRNSFLASQNRARTRQFYRHGEVACLACDFSGVEPEKSARVDSCNLRLMVYKQFVGLSFFMIWRLRL